MAQERKRKVQPPGRDQDREYRITMKIVVDAYDEYERAMGWYCYIQDKLDFPFTALHQQTCCFAPEGRG